MPSTSQTRSPRTWKAAALGVTLAAGFIAGQASCPAPTAQADVRTTPGRDHFKSGSERSETVLREIAATLIRIETRVERIEKSLKESEPPVP